MDERQVAVEAMDMDMDTDLNDADMAMDEGAGFMDVSDLALRHIISYLRNLRDLLALERTCTRFRPIIADDRVWSGQPMGENNRAGIDPRLNFRDSLSIKRTLLRACRC